MADRSVVYRLIADTSQYKREMASAGQVTERAGSQMEGTGKKSALVSSEMAKAGAVAAGAFAGKVIMAAADFDQSMSNIQAATHETAENMDALREATLQAGADTVFSATEAASAVENLAKAGVSTSDILGGGLTGALDLAAAGELDVAQAAEIAATALTQFNLAGEDVPRVADLLAAGAGKAQGDVTDLAMALKQSGLVASQMGVSIEETTGTLAAFASAGLLGSDAGTSFRTMLLRLANPTKESAKLMDELGIVSYDAQGQFVGMAEIAGQLQAAFEGKTQAERDSAMATIFGSDAIRAASVLYEQGQEGVAGWTDEVNDAGYAAETAAIKMDNLRGDIEELMGSVETAMIASGEGSQGMLRTTVQLLTEITNIGGEMGPTIQDSMMPFGEVLNVGIYNLQRTREAIFGVGEASEEGLAAAVGFGSDLMSIYDRLYDRIVTAARGGASGVDGLTDSLAMAEWEAENLRSTMDRLNAVLDGRAEVRDYEAALDDFRDSVNETGLALTKNGRKFDINTEKGRQNQAMLDDIVSSALNVADNMAEADRQKFLTQSIRDIRTMAQDMGLPKGEVRALIALLEEADTTRADPKVKVHADTAAAERAKALVDSIKSKVVTITTSMIGGGQKKAGGGPIYGPGTGTSDSIPAYLSNGEYVIRASAVQKYGVNMFDSLNAMRYASGGAVPRRPSRGEGVYVPPGPDRLDAAIAALAAAVQDQTEMLSNAEAARDEVLGRMQSLADATAALFDTPLFQQASDPWAAGAAGGPLGNIAGDIAGLEQRQLLQDQLKALGMEGDALAALLSQGSNADIAGMIARGEVDQYADLYRRRAALQESVGASAGEMAYGRDLAKLTPAVEAITTELQSMQGQLERMEKRAEKRGADRVEQFAHVINTGASRNARQGVGKK